MPATIERLDTNRLQAMRGRTQVLLTDEGAKSWYVNDVTALLQEVDMLRTEYADTVQFFAADGVEAQPGEPIRRLAERWKEVASGLWEKAQVKRLRQMVRDAQSEVEQARTEISHAKDHITTLNGAAEHWRDEAVALSDKLATTLTEQAQERLQQQEVIEKLLAEVAHLNDAVAAEMQRCEQVVAMQQAQYHAQMEEAAEHAKSILGIAEGR